MKTRTRRRKDRLDLVALDTTRAGATTTSCVSRSRPWSGAGAQRRGRSQISLQLYASFIVIIH